MGFKKFDGSVWQSINPKQLKGIPYTGTLPAVLAGTKAGYLHKYKIYGNLTQNGTPTPENPIMPSGCGERTENLCKISADNSISYSTYTQYSIADDTVYTTGNTLVAFICKVAPNTQYTVSTTATMGSSLRIREYSDFPDNWESGFVTQSLSVACSINSPTSGTIITNANTHYIGVTLFTINKGRFTDIMLAEGSTPLPYEPYGYKLPLTVNGVEYPIYLGEVQTTRRIKKLVLDGTENWGKNTGIINSNAYNVIVPNYYERRYVGLSSHYATVDNVIVEEGVYFGQGINFLTPLSDEIDTIDKWKSYLAAQYTAGTPVTVWYVLAEPETGIVNEPLMKIGDYADTIDSTQTSAQIPTSANSTTISWGGQGLAPSEFDSIQDWVDIPTYTRVNGKWIANFETIIYGFHVDPSVADPANAVNYLLDAVGKTPATNSSSVVDYSDWADAFFMPKPCMLNYDGTVAYYLDPDDYSKKLDGSPSDVANPLFSGNAMMEWPIIWWKYEAGETEGEMSFYVSNRQVDSTYHCWCNIDAENHITDHFYTAIYNGTSATTYSDSATYAVDDLITYSSAEYRCTTAVETPEAFDSTKWEKVSDVTRLRSLSGKALTAANGNGSTTGTVEVQRATANNTTAAVEWYTDVFSDRQLINGLLTLVSKTLDSSAVYGRGLDSVSQSAKEAYVTGTLNDKGLFWGNPSAGTSAKKCFGMENWDGCVWHRTAGLIGSSSTGGYAYKLTYNTADGSTATSYNSTGSGYLVGATGDGTTIARPVNGYVTTMKVASATGIWLPGTVGGSTSTYYCDFYYNGTGYGLAGGSSNSDALCGCWFLNLSRAFGYATWYIAASPSCKPLASRLRLVEGGGS